MGIRRGMRRPGIGDQEMEMLRFVADHAPITVRDVAVQFGEPRGLARTTVLTVMERLREKGYLARTRQGGVYRYAPRVEKAEVLQGLVRDFVERSLGGSVSPFFAYLAKEKDLSEEEIAELRRLLEEAPGRRKEGAP